MNANKITHENIQKIGMHVIELCANNGCTKLQANVFIFGFAMAQKPGNGDAIFRNLIFGIFKCLTTKQRTFLILRRNVIR